MTLSVWLGWFPPYGWAGPRHLVLPALALGIPAGAVLGSLPILLIFYSFQNALTGQYTAGGVKG